VEKRHQQKGRRTTIEFERISPNKKVIDKASLGPHDRLRLTGRSTRKPDDRVIIDPESIELRFRRQLLLNDVCIRPIRRIRPHFEESVFRDRNIVSNSIHYIGVLRLEEEAVRVDRFDSIGDLPRCKHEINARWSHASPKATVLDFPPLETIRKEYSKRIARLNPGLSERASYLISA
jgi:hypothetical protein